MRPCPVSHVTLCVFLPKSMVQTYLEGIDRGLKQLREARQELKEVSYSLAEVKAEGFQNAGGTEALGVLRAASISHSQLLAAVSNLPRLHSGESTCHSVMNPAVTPMFKLHM